MADELKFPDPNARRIRDKDALDSETTRIIRESYLPPVKAGGETAYWSALENRIMAKVRTTDKIRTDDGWSGVLNGWAQIGLVAAAAIFAVGGVISQQLQNEPEEQVAYESVIQTSTPEALSAPAQLITASDRSSRRDAALQYVLSY